VSDDAEGVEGLPVDRTGWLDGCAVLGCELWCINGYKLG